jgi:hypothetical protein
MQADCTPDSSGFAAVEDAKLSPALVEAQGALRGICLKLTRSR